MTDDATIEKLVDRAVQRRLATDAAYRNAANAEEQKQREEQIEREEYERVTGRPYDDDPTRSYLYRGIE